MARKGLKYLNGLSIVSIVFIILTIIPIGILAGIAYSNGEIFDQTITLEANGGYRFEDLSSYRLYGVVYWVEASGDVDVNVYILEDYQYGGWNKSELPKDFVRVYEVHEKFIYIQDEGGYVVFVNPNNYDIHVTYHFIEIYDFSIPWFVLGIIFATFLAILILHTFGYFIKALIIWPITGAGRIESTSERRRDGYYYSNAQPARPAKPARIASPAVVAAPTEKGEVPTAPSPPSPPSPPQEMFIPRKPAINSIGANYIVAGQAKDYHPTNRFLRGLERTWDHTSVAEKILVVLALFFFLTGLVTVTWYNIFVMPLVLLGIATIVFFTGRNRREQLIKMVESSKAIYLQDAARLLRTSTEFIRSDAWKIVRLGLGPIGFDPDTGILFDVTKVDPSKKMDLSPAAQTIHTQLIAEVEKKDEKKEEKTVEEKDTKCPFCEADNPSDSLFCIKCGASLKPAK